MEENYLEDMAAEMSVGGKVALVTGGAQGLGRAFTVELLKRGAKVAITDVNEDVGRATQAELCAEYGQDSVDFRVCDVTNSAAMAEAFSSIKETFGGLDIVINNAGVGNLEKGVWQNMVGVNVTGTFQGTMLAIEHMRRDKGGKGGVIINIASMAGINPNPCGPVYAGTKAAILHFSRSWAANPDMVQQGLRINVVCPAFADTSLYRKILDFSTAYQPQIAQMIIDRVGLMTPEYVAENVMELIEDTSKHGAVMTLSATEGKGYRSTA